MARKRSWPSIAIGAFIALILILYMVTFQVRETEYAVVTTFGRAGDPIRGNIEGGAGLYWKWPWPIQRVHRYDNRLKHLETQLEQTQMSDGTPVLVSTYLLWRIGDPLGFHRSRFTDESARDLLRALLRDRQNAILGQRKLSDLLSPQGEQERLRGVEREILTSLSLTLSERAQSYPMEVREVGIQRILLPEGTTESVFRRMREERKNIAAGYRADGKTRAAQIKTDADTKAEGILAEAHAEARATEAEGDREAAAYYKTFDKAPALALLLLKLDSLKEIAADRATWLFDLSESPFDVLKAVFGRDAGAPAERPGEGPAAGAGAGAERKPGAGGGES
jgi:membrane protease subunit HflC